MDAVHFGFWRRRADEIQKVKDDAQEEADREFREAVNSRRR